LIKLPHFGGVIIEDDVDTHVHVNIDRGKFGNTIIGQGSKINRYAHIGPQIIHCHDFNTLLAGVISSKNPKLFMNLMNGAKS